MEERREEGNDLTDKSSVLAPGRDEVKNLFSCPVLLSC